MSWVVATLPVGSYGITGKRPWHWQNAGKCMHNPICCVYAWFLQPLKSCNFLVSCLHVCFVVLYAGCVASNYAGCAADSDCCDGSATCTNKKCKRREGDHVLGPPPPLPYVSFQKMIGGCMRLERGDRSQTNMLQPCSRMRLQVPIIGAVDTSHGTTPSGPS